MSESEFEQLNCIDYIIPELNFIDNIPDEIVIKIFSLLPIQDLVSAALACRRFHQLSLNEKLWVKFNASEKDLPVQFIARILHRGAKFLRYEQ